MDKELEELAAGRNKPHGTRNRKRDGEAAEAAFLNKATSLGFEVAKPWGDSSRFDFIVHTGSRCWRVQVKSTRGQKDPGYRVMTAHHNVPYTKDNIDFLAAYVVPLNVWYILPAAVVCGKSALWFSTRRRSRSQLEPYREAWCLMACPRDGKCNPEISVWRRCLAAENGECPFSESSPKKFAKGRAGER